MHDQNGFEKKQNNEKHPAFNSGQDITPVITSRRTVRSDAEAVSGSTTGIRRSTNTSGSRPRPTSANSVQRPVSSQKRNEIQTNSNVKANPNVRTNSNVRTSSDANANSNVRTNSVVRTNSNVRTNSTVRANGSQVQVREGAKRVQNKPVLPQRTAQKHVNPYKDKSDFTPIYTEKPPKRRKVSDDDSAGSALSSLLKAVIYIVCILIVSGFLSYFGISIGNDVFALVKSGSDVEITINDMTTVEDIAEALNENNIIKYPSIMKLYASLRKDNGKFVAGTYTVSPNMSYDMLLEVFKGPKSVAKEVRITIPEGYTVDDIITLFVDGYGMGTREGFINAIQYYDFDYWFVKELDELPEGRKYRLEGYLYPDTYYFFSTSSETTIISKFLDNFNTKFDERYRERCEAMNMTADQIVTLASIIQMEAKFDVEYSKISSVFHNRLNNPKYETAGKLDSDATVQYILEERHENLTKEELNIDNRYNTYLYKGLPPGAITNPTTVAINYALFPATTGYYYFVAQKNGYSLFAETYQEHLKNVASVKAG
ncbi:MAG: endolytic transglycosylase MltG [Firmicutes bacterium]|nr:endolytic transglycosylase MltG [Bacillota bacterium]